MKIRKEKGENSGFIIYLKIGNSEYKSWWASPPSKIDHVDLEYLRNRYSIITTEKRAVEFKILWKILFVEISERQKEEMKHTLGMDYKKKPYRNYFYCNKDDVNWNDLVEKGLAIKGGSWNNEDENCYFKLSKEGVEFILGKQMKESIYKEL